MGILISHQDVFPTLLCTGIDQTKPLKLAQLVLTLDFGSRKFIPCSKTVTQRVDVPMNFSSLVWSALLATLRLIHSYMLK
jgi:hypothetical protein